MAWRNNFRIFPALLAVLCFSTVCAAQQTTTDRFDLHGRVINSATGEPVAGALVQICCQRRSQFTGLDGTFRFADLPAGRLSIDGRKQGFFNDQELGRLSAAKNAMISVPAEGEVVIKLAPEAILYGEVKDENGDPVEGVRVSARRWSVQNGQRKLLPAAEAVTDDQGSFRIAELKSGSYYLSLVARSGGYSIFAELSRKKNVETGYGSQFYPGVTDVGSATPISVRPGAQVHISQILSRERLFDVSGVVHGANPDRGFSVTLVDRDGSTVQKRVRINSKTGEFQIQGVPAGTYMFTASDMRSRRGAESKSWNVSVPVYVNADVSGLSLTLGQGISLGAQVRDETTAAAGTDTPRRVWVHLVPRQFSRFPYSILVPPEDRPNAPSRFEGLFPGTYEVQATPQFPGYVASLRCGDVDLLREDLVIAPGTAPPPIEVTLRDDGAGLTIHFEKTRPATVVIYSEEYPKRSGLTTTNTTFSLSQLAPGNYKVFAVEDTEDLEIHDPAAMQPYLKHATEVTLHPGDDAALRLELLLGEEPLQ